MQKIAFYMLLVFLVTIACNNAKAEEHKIQRLTVYSAYWDDLFRGQMTPQKVIQAPKGFVKISTEDTFLCLELEDALTSSEATDSRWKIDSRIVCLLTYSDGSTDTLNFGNFEFFELNTRKYKLNWHLFDIVMRMLPYDHRVRVEYYKNNNYRYKYEDENR